MRCAIANSTRPRDDRCSSSGAAAISSHTPIPSRAAETRRNRLLSLVFRARVLLLAAFLSAAFAWSSGARWMASADPGEEAEPHAKTAATAPGVGQPVGSPKRDAITFRFLAPDGKCVRNALMGFGVKAGAGGWGMGTLKTGADGLLTLHGRFKPPVWFFFAANGVGYAKLDVPSDKVIAIGEPVVVRLSSGPSVSGTIVARSSGTPLGGIKVYPWRVLQDGDPWRMWNATFGFKSYRFTVGDAMSATSRDGDGAFALGPLPPGDYRLVAGLPASVGIPLVVRSKVVEVPVTVAKDKNVEGMRLEVKVESPAYRVRGRLLRRDGVTPLASTAVTIAVSHDSYLPGQEPEDRYVWEPLVRDVVTDLHGNFTLYPVSPGTYKFQVQSGKLSGVQTAAIHSDRVRLDFVLR